MSDREKASKEALDALIGREGVVGAALVGRDGLPVLQEFNRACNVEAVAAMGAAVLGASDAALLEMGGHEARRFTTESDRLRFLGYGIDDELLLLLVTEVALDREEAERLIEQASDSLRGILQEA